MVYAKRASEGYDLAAGAQNILQHCQAMALAELSQRLAVPAAQVQSALQKLVSLGYVERLQQAGRWNTASGAATAAMAEEEYYRLVRRGDGDWREYGHPRMSVLKGGA